MFEAYVEVFDHLTGLSEKERSLVVERFDGGFMFHITDPSDPEFKPVMFSMSMEDLLKLVGE